jgi:hypothetical protein
MGWLGRKLQLVFLRVERMAKRKKIAHIGVFFFKLSIIVVDI